MKRKKYLIGILFLAAFLLVACNRTSTEKKILTTTNTYYEPVKSIVGKKYEVEPLIKSTSVDPHDFKPTTKVSKQITGAPLVVANGLGYDDWVNDIVEANNMQDSKLSLGEDVLHQKQGSNAHLWFKVDNVKKLSKSVYERVSESDKLNKKTYKRNYQAYIKKLNKLTDKEQQIKQTTNGKKAYITEPLPYYLLQDLGIKVQDSHFAKAIEDGTDPSIKDVQEIQTGLKNNKVDYLVVNKQVTSGVIKKIVKTAKENNVKIIYLTETLPRSVGYYKYMNDILDKFAN